MASKFGGNSQQQIATIVKAVGGRVEQVRVNDTSAGERVMARIMVPSSWASFVMLQMLARSDVADPVVRNFARQLHTHAGPEAGAFARAVQQWVQENVAYIRETNETFQDSATTLATRGGDCDDHARLVFSLLLSAGFNARIAPLFKGKDNVSHAVTQAEVGGRWCWVETTVAAQFDEHPIAAARRLGLSVRKDLAAPDTVVGA